MLIIDVFFVFGFVSWQLTQIFLNLPRFISAFHLSSWQANSRICLGMVSLLLNYFGLERTEFTGS
jgi:hypothetical protein